MIFKLTNSLEEKIVLESYSLIRSNPKLFNNEFLEWIEANKIIAFFSGVTFHKAYVKERVEDILWKDFIDCKSDMDSLLFPDNSDALLFKLTWL